MRKVRNLLLDAARRDWRVRAMGVVRPGIEAMLLAAVALGAAQAGWAVLTPHSAGAAGSSPADESDVTRPRADLRTPFAPAAGLEGAGQAAAALASSVRVAGVRVAPEPSRSGAVLALEDGAQRAFGVGQEIAPGLTLAEVRADYVLVSFAGGQQQLAVQGAAPSFSFARAMMGQPQEGEAPAPETLADAAEAAWFASTLAKVQPDGWRVEGPVPARAAAAGLHEGDVILAVNGAGPQNALAALGAAGAARIELSVRRAGGERVNLAYARDARS